MTYGRAECRNHVYPLFSEKAGDNKASAKMGSHVSKKNLVKHIQVIVSRAKTHNTHAETRKNNYYLLYSD